MSAIIDVVRAEWFWLLTGYAMWLSYFAARVADSVHQSGRVARILLGITVFSLVLHLVSLWLKW